MARKELIYTVPDEGRDKGKAFHITEMPARPGHRWATRVLFAVMNAGVELDDNVLNSGFAGLASVGLQALGKVHIDVAEPLLNELFDCIKAIPDPSRPAVMRPLCDDDTEEVSTLFKLQFQVVNLHVDFFTNAK